jgi:hypothetical protein
MRRQYHSDHNIHRLSIAILMSPHLRISCLCSPNYIIYSAILMSPLFARVSPNYFSITFCNVSLFETTVFHDNTQSVIVLSLALTSIITGSNAEFAF